jgi:hypothetical protein
VIVRLYVPVAVVVPAVTVKVEEPEPGAGIDAGAKLPLAPEGSPEIDSETAELKLPLTLVEMPAVCEPPCVTLTLPDAAIVKSLDDVGLKTMSITGCSSIPFGATPVWPCKKSNIPIPVTRTGVLVVLKDVVAVNFASNWLLACEIPEANGLPAPTQEGRGISAIIVLPALSLSTRW